MFTIVNSYKKVPPNRAMIVYGLGGKRVVQGGSTFVIPGFQNNKTISMMLMSFDVLPAQPMFSKQGIKLNIEAVAQIKIKSDPTAILTASEQFIDRPDKELSCMNINPTPPNTVRNTNIAVKCDPKLPLECMCD